MINLFINKIRDFFSKGHIRSLKAKKNIAASFLLNGLNVAVSFALVPMTLNYLDVTRYGLWLIISSIMMWIGFFDIGLGNGLRNKFAEAIAKGETELAKTYVSTTYVLLALIMGGLCCLFLTINPFLNWAKILNADLGLKTELSSLALIVFCFFALRFVLQLIGTILTADQRPAINNSLVPIANALALIIIFILSKTTEGSLLLFGITLSSTPVVVLIIASWIFYKNDYKQYLPSFKYVAFKYFKPLANLGVKFFILQLACLVIFSTDNIIIAQILGPAEVTPYNIAFKYFGLLIMAFTIIITPFWSAYTEAITKNDIKWIKTSIKKLIKIWLFIIAGAIMLFAISKNFYLMWVGDKVHIPVLLSAFMGLYVIINTWNNIFVYFINGVGKIKLQMYYGIVAMIINIPISIFFAKNLNMGSAGVILGTCFSLLGGFALGPIQYYKIINGKAQGIWCK